MNIRQRLYSTAGDSIWSNQVDNDDEPETVTPDFDTMRHTLEVRRKLDLLHLELGFETATGSKGSGLQESSCTCHRIEQIQQYQRENISLKEAVQFYREKLDMLTKELRQTENQMELSQSKLTQSLTDVSELRQRLISTETDYVNVSNEYAKCQEMKKASDERNKILEEDMAEKVRRYDLLLTALNKQRQELSLSRKRERELLAHNSQLVHERLKLDREKALMNETNLFYQEFLDNNITFSQLPALTADICVDREQLMKEIQHLREENSRGKKLCQEMYKELKKTRPKSYSE